jgi:hypothetical protein
MLRDLLFGKLDMISKDTTKHANSDYVLKVMGLRSYLHSNRSLRFVHSCSVVYFSLTTLKTNIVIMFV